MKIIGFTGSRVGMTNAQKATLRALWSCGLTDEETWLHHGDCVGCDATAHDLAKAVGFKIAIHPPSDDRLRAFKSGDLLYAPLPYIARNKEIVDASEHLIACPSGPEELRSGTWSTIRYARRVGRPITVIRPDGQIPKSVLP